MPIELKAIHQANVTIFAHFMRQYLQCSDAVQEVVVTMVEILDDETADDDDKRMAFAMIEEALLPSIPLGIDLEELDELDRQDPEARAVIDGMEAEEASFAARVQSMMKDKGMTQTDLAEAIGIQQPAVSMFLNRQARPQQRTVLKIAEALGTTPETLWPNFNE